MKNFKKIISPLLVFTFSSFITYPSIAAPLNAQCTLQINGVMRMNSKCNFEINISNGTDSFSDEKLLIVCPNRKPIDKTSCYGYQQSVARKGVFGYLFRDGFTARLCWNEGVDRKADPCFNGLRKNGACWESNSARDNFSEKWYDVRFCAYSL